MRLAMLAVLIAGGAGAANAQQQVPPLFGSDFSADQSFAVNVPTYPGLHVTGLLVLGEFSLLFTGTARLLGDSGIAASFQS